MRGQFLRGLRHGLPVCVAIVPFALLFGVVASDAGLSLWQTLVMTGIVLAGASMLAAIDVLADGGPVLVAVIAGIAVNLRMMIYSAALAPHLGKGRLSLRLWAAYLLVDHAYAISIADWEAHPERTLDEKFGFYFGLTLSVVPFWVLVAIIGVLVGKGIPEEWGLEFAGAIVFTALFAQMIKGRPHVVAAIVAAAVALFLNDLPHSLGLIAGGVAGMAAGAVAASRLEPAK